MEILTFIAEFDTLMHMNSLFQKGVGKLSSCVGRHRPKSGFLSICLLLVIGLMPFAHGETNVASSAVMETNHTYIIDARTEGEWKAGRIKGAILIPYDQIKERIAEVTTNKSAHIALYCRSGRRSGIALKSLQKLGYRNVENLGSFDDARKNLGVSP